MEMTRNNPYLDALRGGMWTEQVVHRRFNVSDLVSTGSAIDSGCVSWEPQGA